MMVSEQDFRYMVEGLTADLVRLLIEREGYNIQSAIDAVYQSKTFAALNRPQTGLYFQSPGYVYDYLLDELKH